MFQMRALYQVQAPSATLDAKAAYSDADFVVIAAPTNVYPKFSVDFS